MEAYFACVIFGIIIGAAGLITIGIALSSAEDEWSSEECESKEAEEKKN